MTPLEGAVIAVVLRNPGSFAIHSISGDLALPARIEIAAYGRNLAESTTLSGRLRSGNVVPRRRILQRACFTTSHCCIAKGGSETARFDSHLAIKSIKRKPESSLSHFASLRLKLARIQFH